MLTLSARLNDLKTSKKLLQKQVAEGSGIPLRTYRRYENGEREPTVAALVALADFFNVSTDYLTCRTNNPARL